MFIMNYCIISPSYGKAGTKTEINKTGLSNSYVLCIKLVKHLCIKENL